MVGVPAFYHAFPELANQTIILNTTSGPTAYTLQDIDEWYYTAVYMVLFDGVVLGGSCLVFPLVALQVLRKPTAINMLNFCSVFFVILHAATFTNSYTSAWNSFTSLFTGSYINVSLFDFNSTAAGNIFEAFKMTFIELTLVAQVYAIVQTRQIWRYVICGTIFALVSLPVIVVQFVYIGSLMYGNLHPEQWNEIYDKYYGINVCNNPLFAASICFYALILTTKLGFALRRRRKLGLKQFDAFQILFIMTSQTLIVPAIFTILSFSLTAEKTEGLTLFTPFLVVVSLPLTSVWANFQITAPNISTHSLMPYNFEESSITTRTSSSDTNVPISIPVDIEKGQNRIPEWARDDFD